MLVVNQLAGFNARGTGGGSALLYEIIQELGLNSNLVLCLDAADTRSYDGTSQTWTDIVAGNNFFLGATSGAEASDPTFNGTAGLATEATYFSFDGGDYFTETTTHTFADNWHKDNGALSIVCAAFIVNSVSPRHLFSNIPSGAGSDGIALVVSGTEALSFSHAITNTTEEVASTSATIPVSAWNFLGMSFNEAGPTCNMRINATAEAPTVVASTATDNNSQPLLIGARGDAGLPMASGERLACIAGWSTAIGSTALGDLYTLLKARRFTSLP